MVATYSLPADFYTNTVAYFGKDITLNVTLTYPGGSDSQEITVHVLDRTVKKVLDPAYRSITLDPFFNDTFREGGLNLPLTLDVVLKDGSVFTLVPEWPDDSIITNKGYFDANYKVAFTCYYESKDGAYGVIDLTDDGIDNPRYVLISEYDGTYTGTRYAKGATQNVTMPLMVLTRAAEKAEFVFDGFEEQSANDKYSYSSHSVTYGSKDANLGNVIDVVYDNDTNLPEEVVFYNAYSFGDPSLPRYLDVTFDGTGEVRRYYLETEGFTQFFGKIDVTESTSYDVTLHVYPTEAKEFEIFLNGKSALKVKVTIKKTDVTRFNSDVASSKLSTDNLNYTGFEVYTENTDATSAYNTANYADTFTFYPDGKFITVSEYEAGEYAGAKWLGDSSKYLYKVLGNGTVLANGEVSTDSDGNRIGTPYYYRYNVKGRTYTALDTNVVSDKDNTYVFVFTVRQTLNATWDTSDTTVSVDGGTSYVVATVTSPVTIIEGVANNATSTVRVPIEVNDATIKSVSIASSDFVTGGDASHMSFANGTYAFTFDPYTTPDVFEQIFKADNEGTYKLENGKYVELSKEEIVQYSGQLYSVVGYKYFPAYVTIVTETGTSVRKEVTWNFGASKVSYEGGTFAIRATVKGDGVKDQTILASLVINPRTVTGLASGNDDLTKNTGFYLGTSEGQTYINPYEYLSKNVTLPSTLNVNVTKGDGTATTEVKTFGGSDGYTLAWNFSKFNPTYEGGMIYLIAVLTGPDGIAQEFEIPFLVQRMYASSMTTVFKLDEERKSSPTITSARYSSAAYTATVSDSVATTYTINANDSASYSIPQAYKVTFTISNPDVTDGKVTGWTSTTTGTGWTSHANGATNAKVFTYVSLSMPGGFSLTADILANGMSTAKNATIQLGTGERITIPFVVSSATASAPTYEGLKLDTKTSSGLPVVWYGTAVVYDISGGYLAHHSVMFASDTGSYTLTSTGNRKIVYYLYAAVGSPVDTASRVLDTTIATSTIGSITVSGNKFGVVNVGQEIPNAQAVYGNGTSGSTDPYVFTVNRA